ARVWNAIPWDLGYGEAEKVDDYIYRFFYDDYDFLLVKVHHPSMGYPSEKSHRRLAKAGVVPK
ncbi:MAG: hypothetical protein IKO40_06105, partial [Kiritimatiellae bacterium]|nr:hypothetical protein [Kiritimatiellia bacterium]